MSCTSTRHKAHKGINIKEYQCIVDRAASSCRLWAAVVLLSSLLFVLCGLLWCCGASTFLERLDLRMSVTTYDGSVKKFNFGRDEAYKAASHTSSYTYRGSTYKCYNKLNLVILLTY